MATKLVAGDLEFLDPNFCCWRFGKSQDLFRFITEHIEEHYPDLLSWMAEVYRYRPTAVQAMAG